MTRKQRQHWQAFCSDPLKLIENYQQAETDKFAGWCLHHRRELQPDGTKVSMQELIDQGLYWNRPASELIFMRHGEHTTLHNAGNTYMKGKHLSVETCKKMSINNGRFWKGKHHSEETRQKMSNSHKGKSAGMLWWNDRIHSTMSRECPGEGWKRGRLKRT